MLTAPADLTVLSSMVNDDMWGDLDLIDHYDAIMGSEVDGPAIGLFCSLRLQPYRDVICVRGGGGSWPLVERRIG